MPRVLRLMSCHPALFFFFYAAAFYSYLHPTFYGVYSRLLYWRDVMIFSLHAVHTQRRQRCCLLPLAMLCHVYLHIMLLFYYC